MASISLQQNGRRTIQFVGTDGRRRSIRLGKATQREAAAIRVRVEQLLAARMNNTSMARDTAAWLAEIGDVLHVKLAAAGLVESRQAGELAKLGPFIEDYILRRVDIKPRTVINLNHAKKPLIGYFSTGKSISSFTPGDADRFRLHLIGKGLAENTVRRICGRARQFFRAAMRSDLIRLNPFDGIKCTVGANPDRLQFVSRGDIAKVLACCPDDEWKLIVALSRYGGLRCPSEHLALRWADVDWEHNRVTVRSPKTEHHEGKASRIMPIFPELRPFLLEAFDQAAEGAEFVIARYRDANANLRTRFQRIIERAGLKPWPKLFHNLRATRETELAETFPLHVVCAWIGNSQSIAAKHYLQVTDEHFERAIVEPKKAVQNPVQQEAALNGSESQTPSGDVRKTPELQAVAGECKSVRRKGIPPTA